MLSAQIHSLPHEILSHDQVSERFPVFHLNANEIAIYDPEAGYLVPELCIAAHLARAMNNGAELHFEEPVESWTEYLPDLNAFRITTGKSSYLAKKIVLAVGAWVCFCILFIFISFKKINTEILCSGTRNVW